MSPSPHAQETEKPSKNYCTCGHVRQSVILVSFFISTLIIVGEVVEIVNHFSLIFLVQ